MLPSARGTRSGNSRGANTSELTRQPARAAFARPSRRQRGERQLFAVQAAAGRYSLRLQIAAHCLSRARAQTSASSVAFAHDSRAPPGQPLTIDALAGRPARRRRSSCSPSSVRLSTSPSRRVPAGSSAVSRGWRRSRRWPKRSSRPSCQGALPGGERTRTPPRRSKRPPPAPLGGPSHSPSRPAHPAARRRRPPPPSFAASSSSSAPPT